MKVLATYSIKGGVGKTATATNLAAAAAHDCERTLLCDLDPQGASTFYFRVQPRVRGGGRRLLEQPNRLLDRLKGTDFEFLDLLPADPSYRELDLVLDRLGQAKKSGRSKPSAPGRKDGIARLLSALEDQFDYVILDCPPSITLLSENVFRAADALVVPVIPTTLSERTLDQLTKFCQKSSLAHLRLLPFFSMVEQRKGLHRETIRQLPERHPEMLQTQIPFSAEIERMGVERAPVRSYAPASRGAKAFADLWTEVRSLVHARLD